MSQDALSKENKSKIELKSSEVKNVIKSFNAGLIQDMITVYLYEVYRIQYDANGGIGDNLSEGWKWHKIDYLLAENKFSKTENGEIFVANGWNTSKAGNGTNYSSGAMYYREDASQIFYAKFFASGENYYTVKWIIDNGSKRYALSRDFNVWFDTSIEQYQSRDTGVLVAEGDLITLPQIQIDENGKSLSSIFGGYILGWYTEEENIPYSIGMTATRNVTFVAELNFDINDFVQCKFLGEENEEIHYSGLIANGAQAYMALSGMDANLIRDYNEGYKKWVAQYAFEYLDASGKPDGVLEFNLGTKEVIEDEPEKEVVTTCASCEKSLKDYIKWVGKNISEDDINLLQEIKIKNIYEYLRENECKLKLKKAVKVTYHKPCNIDNFEDIEWLLKNTENLEYVEMKDYDKCCGLNGLSKIKEYKIMKKIFKEKQSNIISTKTKIVLTSCLGCEIGLKAYSLGKYKVFDLVSFIAKYL